MRKRLLRAVAGITIVLVAGLGPRAAATAAAPEVVRTSEDLRGMTCGTVWGDGFVEGKTVVRAAVQDKTWDVAAINEPYRHWTLAALPHIQGRTLGRVRRRLAMEVVRCLSIELTRSWWRAKI